MANENDELTAIKQILTSSNTERSISAIQQQLTLKIEPRTLLRRLNKLTEQGVVVKRGIKKGTTYEAIKKAADYEATTSDHTRFLLSDSELIPLGSKSHALLTLLDRSTEHRTPVGYNRNFLELYRPNITSYLSEKEKALLAAAGKTEIQNEMAGTYAKNILQRLLIDLSYNSSRLEGNTYSLLDTERLIAIGEVADDKSVKDAQMILNHKEAIEFTVQNSTDIGFNRYTILNIHGLLSNNLLTDPAASGRLRKSAVGIQHSVFHPLEIPQVIEEMFELILQKAAKINDPFEQALFVMVQLPYLQPFEDVNKRVSRLASNISLIKKNLVPVSFIDVPKSLYIKGMLAVYELNDVSLIKDVFMWAYERSSARYSALRQSLGEPDLFRVKYRDAIRSLITAIVTEAYSFTTATNLIKLKTNEIPVIDQYRFMETVETELLSLHEGNIARYFIRPSQFLQWKDGWRRR